ncbi:carboxylesterase/lipase family protein [uncultured Corynebacterium sp.]|mgnify:CR=1 FL=1|uniref:carboxylesterase/lipase family protein n=1 Tax=uncultured Corynebacterium sp. TaxID=159447 RepID=UPI0025CEB072|nr:carboxylesterase/lipase family protein [uncultured Corynebacterium sp.]
MTPAMRTPSDEPFPDPHREPSAQAARAAALAAHRRAQQASRRAANALADELTVRTTAGWVKGLYEELDPLTRVRSWRGIPFGADTSGPLRFAAPQPAPAWQGVRPCREFGPVAPQSTYSWTDKIIGSEDCLHLDVVRPDTDEQLPVVVYLHGGSFFMGSSHMLMLRGFQLAHAMNVVYVSVNFRLGALGYLDVRSLPNASGDTCANPAVADQLLALRWVRDNIASFGGDATNITLMGESAGGAAVLALMTSPHAKGLFHRAIAQSPPIATVHSKTQSTLWARELVRRLALPRLTTVGDLRAQDFADIVRTGQSMMWRAGELLHLNSCFAPTVDGDLLPEHPIEAFENGHQMQIPLMLGTNSDEASFGKFLFQREFARRRAGLRLLSSFDQDGARDVVAAYDGAATRSDFAELLADALFWGPTVRVADAHAATSPTWMYRFDFAPVALRALGLGAMHSLELSNVFGDSQASRMSMLTRMGSTANSDELTVQMQTHWAAFIHGARPGPEWPRYRVSHPADPAQRSAPDTTRLRSTFIFDADSHVVSDPKPDKRAAWEGYDMLNWGSGRPDLAAKLGFIVDQLD